MSAGRASSSPTSTAIRLTVHHNGSIRQRQAIGQHAGREASTSMTAPRPSFMRLATGMLAEPSTTDTRRMPLRNAEVTKQNPAVSV